MLKLVTLSLTALCCLTVGCVASTEPDPSTGSEVASAKKCRHALPSSVGDDAQLAVRSVGDDAQLAVRSVGDDAQLASMGDDAQGQPSDEDDECE